MKTETAQVDVTMDLEVQFDHGPNQSVARRIVQKGRYDVAYRSGHFVFVYDSMDHSTIASIPEWYISEPLDHTRRGSVMNGILSAEERRTREILTSALKYIAEYDTNSPRGEGICPYGCDCPAIARAALIAASLPAPKPILPGA